MKKIVKALSVVLIIVSAVGLCPDIGAAYSGALSEAVSYLSGGVTVEAGDDISSYNGVNITWSNIRNNTIADEKASYETEYYLQPDGSVITPQWFEGDIRLKADATLSFGGATAYAGSVDVVLRGGVIPEFSPEEINDHIDIGDLDSEAAGFSSVRVTEPKTRIVGGRTETYRQISKNGSMGLTLRCSGEETNYFTVKLWGGDVSSTSLWIVDNTTEETKGHIDALNTRAPTRNSLVDRNDWVELNFQNNSIEQFSGGFIYATYEIPKIYTAGREYITLRLYSTGSSSDYASVSITEQREDSRGIYAVYMGTDPCFDPNDFGEAVSRDEVQTADVETIVPDEQRETVENLFWEGVESFKNWQIYGGSNYPSYMEGMQTRSEDWKNKPFDSSDWKDAYYNSSRMLKQNLTPLNMFEVFAKAYTLLPDGDEQKDELLDRIIKGIDFLARAQGLNGGWYSGNGWIGGGATEKTADNPDGRLNASGNHLEGFGVRSAGMAVAALYDEIALYLSEPIDSDADGETDSSRYNAWEEMFSKAWDYYTNYDGAGHAPNQDMAQIISALRFQVCLKLMGSDELKSDDELKRQLDICFGREINKAVSSYWVSPKGLILENFGSVQGGYSGGYGMNALAELSQAAEIGAMLYPENADEYNEVVKKAYDAADNFLFTYADENGTPKQYAEGIISARNAQYPGAEKYICDPYAALEVGSKTSLKMQYNAFAMNYIMLNQSTYRPSNAHFEDNIVQLGDYLLNWNEYAAAFEENNIAEYTYKGDDETLDQYAWADEMARAVVIKNAGETLYMALNWRSPMHTSTNRTGSNFTFYNSAGSNGEQKIYANNLGRIHHKSEGLDRYGYFEVTTADSRWAQSSFSNWTNVPYHYMDAIMYAKYGEYTVIMNSTGLTEAAPGADYTIPQDLGLDGVYKDLISGEVYSFGEERSGYELCTSVPPATTMVLVSWDNYKISLSADNFLKYTDKDGVEELPQPDPGLYFNGDQTEAAASPSQKFMYIDLGAPRYIKSVAVYAPSYTDQDGVEAYTTGEVAVTNSLKDQNQRLAVVRTSKDADIKTGLEREVLSLGDTAKYYTVSDVTPSATSSASKSGDDMYRYLMVYDWSQACRISEIEIRVDMTRTPFDSRIDGFSVEDGVMEYSYTLGSIEPVNDAYFAVYDQNGVLVYLSKNQSSGSAELGEGEYTAKLMVWERDGMIPICEAETFGRDVKTFGRDAETFGREVKTLDRDV